MPFLVRVLERAKEFLVFLNRELKMFCTQENQSNFFIKQEWVSCFFGTITR